VTRPPWEYFFESFSSGLFPQLFHPTWIASLVLLVLLIVLYNVRTRQLHRHDVYLQMYEWLLWTGVITFSMLIVGAVFVFDFILVLATAIIGLGMLVWIRFRRFPPLLEAYEQRLARQRYVSRQKFATPEATIRQRTPRRRRRRR
jgi:ABC-type xylose transport system permease subunit